jgi:predicted anti-sigma-YlaC factor YlaD
MAEEKDLRREACKEFEQDLVLYYYHECGEAEQRRVSSHLASCASCQALLLELKTLLPGTIKADEPAPTFWQDYSRELRTKLAENEEKSDWRQGISWLFRRWPVPAVATAMILALALTFTKGWLPLHQPRQEREPMEMAAVTDNLDFFNSMDFLDSMDLMEAVEGHDTQTNETTSHPL